MDVITPIPLDQIDTSGRIRSPSPEQVESLKQSILEIGLINPITVTYLGEKSYRLIAGGNRLEAYRSAGFDVIDATVVDYSFEAQAVIAECDENLCGPNLSVAERALFTAKRKEAYEVLHPETKAGVAGSEARWNATDNLSTASFATETAKISGKDERTVRRDAERGQKVIPEALKLVTGTKLDNGVYLDKLKTLPPNEQIHAVKRDLKCPPAPPSREQGVPQKVAEPDGPTYDQVQAALAMLGNLQPRDYLRLCPPPRRAGMCARMAQIVSIFETVCEEAVQ